ncbi:kinase-like domain-containing protein [Chlamydoabsidia padenii]|nr:kinase-like domain-containing protein [Chlamydoabsidia padenii]
MGNALSHTSTLDPLTKKSESYPSTMSALCTTPSSTLSVSPSLKRTKSRWRSQVGDASISTTMSNSIPKTTTIKDIGKPTHFEHGIHVEYNRLTGKFMGLPDVWQSNLPSDDVLNTNYINPNLVPTLPGIGKPYNIQHNVHVQVDDYGLVGLPSEWQKILQASGVIQSSTIPLPPPPSFTPAVSDQEGSSILELLLQEQDHQRMYATTNDTGIFTDTLLRQLQHRPLPSIDIDDDHYDDITSNNTSPITHETCDTSMRDLHMPSSLSTSSLSFGSHFIDDIVETGPPSAFYSDLTLIAEGDSGPMYAAKHSLTNRLVAIKKISPFAKEKLAKLDQELNTMKMSRHPNIIELVGKYTVDDDIWVVTEYMDISLADIIASSSALVFTEANMARITREVVRALAHLHRLHRIHRDIRSDNILLNMRGDIKLADFSQCAQLIVDQDKRRSVVGTPYWMAPEVIKGTEYDTKADIWSLGVTLMEMAQGNPPYIDHPPLRAVFLIAANGVPDMDCPEKWSDLLLDFIKQCTTIDTYLRPDAEQLLKHPFLALATTPEITAALVKKTKQLDQNQYEQEIVDSLDVISAAD